MCRPATPLTSGGDRKPPSHAFLATQTLNQMID
jgi:hypothetical protein